MHIDKMYPGSGEIFNDGPGRSAFRTRSNRHVDPAGGLPRGGVLAVHPTRSFCRTCAPASPISRFFRSIGIPRYGLMPPMLPRAEHGKIHGVDERIPVDGIEDMTDIVYKLI